MLLGINFVNVLGFCSICSSLEMDAEPSALKHLVAGQGISSRAGPLGMLSESQPGSLSEPQSTWPHSPRRWGWK